MKFTTVLAGLAVAAGLAAAPGLAAAQTIDTMPSWDGQSSISSWGTYGTAVYGETFTAPGSALTGFTFEVDNHGQDSTVVAQVYAWSGSLFGGNGPQGATGAALFSSDTFTIGGVYGFQAVHVDTGSTPLTIGQNYVILLADTGNDQTSGVWGLTGFFSHPGVAHDGGFNFYNSDYQLSSISANSWDSFADFGSLAYTATFTGGAVPEPATWALMIAGFGGAGGMLRRRRIQAATA